MARFQGCNANGEPMSSAFVERDVDPGIDCSQGGPSLTRQEFAEECDINVLMARYEKTGAIPPMNAAEPQYLDVADFAGIDLMTAMDVLERADRSFMSLPARTRAEFDNDPMKFVAFCEDAKNLDKLREWGLAAPVVPKPEPQEVRIVNPPGAPEGAADAKK